MKLALILKFMSVAYRMILRDLLKKAIDDPNEEWDDMILKMLDSLFGYEEAV